VPPVGPPSERRGVRWGGERYVWMYCLVDMGGGCATPPPPQATPMQVKRVNPPCSPRLAGAVRSHARVSLSKCLACGAATR
jgi:hypothetical protein